MTNGYEPAMPDSIAVDQQGNVFPASHYSAWVGLTKREIIATAAMQGMLANSGKTPNRLKDGSIHADILAAHAVLLADSLIAQLNK